MSDPRVEHYKEKMMEIAKRQGTEKQMKEQIRRWKEGIKPFHEMQEALKQFIDDLEQPPIFRIGLMNVGKRAWALARRFSGRKLAAELKVEKFKWKERGLPTDAIATIIEFVLKRRENEKG